MSAYNIANEPDLDSISRNIRQAQNDLNVSYNCIDRYAVRDVHKVAVVFEAHEVDNGL